VSSAILYLAIIAIWAGVLIPRWLKRDSSRERASKSSRERLGEQPTDLGADLADDDGAVIAGGPVTPGEGPADRDGVPGAQSGAWDETEIPEPGGRGVTMEPQAAEAEGRSRILAARRRMLMLLLVLAAGAIGIVSLGLAAWWVAGPPLIMLGGYLLLLREASRADAERAHALATADARQRLRDERTPDDQHEQPTSARVIDISDRVRDELYDQYADAARRAVGD
jgi:membrane protein implicated in regulation of membrane protease activity